VTVRLPALALEDTTHLVPYLQLKRHKSQNPRNRSRPLKHQSKHKHLPRKSPSLKKIQRSSRLKMMKRKLMEEDNPRLHHIMKLLEICHLLQ
jgi:hypothetical protein